MASLARSCAHPDAAPEHRSITTKAYPRRQPPNPWGVALLDPWQCLLDGRCGALLGVNCIAALRRLASLPRHRSEKAKIEMPLSAIVRLRPWARDPGVRYTLFA
jgi:hypothetical protein